MEGKQQQFLVRQQVIAEAIQKIGTNFSKDSAHRKTSSYLQVRLNSVNTLWEEFEINNTVLQGLEDKTDDYFTTQAYEKVQASYKQIRDKLLTCPSHDASGNERSGNTETETGALSKTDELLEIHSSMTHVTRVLSWVMRFINNARDVKQAKRTSYLTTSDIEFARNMINKTIQQINFADDIYHLQKHNKVRASSKILNLNPILDKQGTLRVGGRLRHANLDESLKYPMILPNNHKLTELLIDQAHKQTLHGGAKLTLLHLRSQYWILGGLKTIKKQLLKCVTCHRFKTQYGRQPMADLPKPRVTPSRPFTHTGVDFTGHVEVKANKGRGIKTMKAYIAIFVCLCTKAIHLELVSDLSSATFMAALKRLCARRGAPKHIYSDNGTNFVGAAKTLAKEREKALQLCLNDSIITNISEFGIEWHFNAPSWPTAGGLWEAAVKSMKHHLKRVLGDQKLTYEEFTTLLVQIEACLNSRPLVALTNDTDDVDCLTPGHFLVGGPVLAPLLVSEIETTSLTTRWRLTEKMYTDFWKRWAKDYLQTLQVRGKWQTPTRNIEVGEIVLVKEDNLPPAKWLLGRVIDTHPGTDGLVRVVTLKTKTNNMKRPITKLSRLPIDTERQIDSERSEQQSHDKQSSDQPTNKAKRSKTSACTSYLNVLFVLLLTCVAPSTSQMVNITSLDPARLVYFDKIADMQVIQDDWKMVVYYNMSTYWRSVDLVEQYVNNLHGFCKRKLVYLTIATQFEHELNELKHYNELLRSEHGTRKKRGLINGIGNIANSLFGVLDDSFAKKYNKDIKLLQGNENHLLNLYKQQTSIIEGQYNILKRNEQVMNQQFVVINRHLRESEQNIKTEQEAAMYITATALSANMIVANLRRVQELLLDLVTDVRNGKIDTHLLKPDAFQDQLNIISGQVPKGLSLPCMNNHKCVRDMYKLSRVHVKLIEDYLLFEVKIPLVKDEQYELSKVIPIHNIKDNKMTHIVPTAEYLAVNLQNDMLIPMSQNDFSSCIHNDNQLLCAINTPITNNICEAQIINNQAATSCHTEVSSCSDQWIKLHNRGAWLFTCCEERSTRIFCPAGVTSQTLRNIGIITLSAGCMLKGDQYIIHSHNILQSKVEINDELYIPESRINNLVNISNVSNISFQAETHEEQLRILKENIQLVKRQQQSLTIQANAVDTDQYVTYSFMSICCLAISIWGAYKIHQRFCNRDHTNAGTIQSPSPPPAVPVQVLVDRGTCSDHEDHCSTRVDRATSPAMYRSKC